MAICHYIWYEDWRCAECCQGDRCNYYVTASSSCRNSIILDLEYLLTSHSNCKFQLGAGAASSNCLLITSTLAVLSILAKLSLFTWPTTLNETCNKIIFITIDYWAPKNPLCMIEWHFFLLFVNCPTQPCLGKSMIWPFQRSCYHTSSQGYLLMMKQEGKSLSDMQHSVILDIVPTKDDTIAHL